MTNLIFTFRPIYQWPRPLTKNRISGPFKASYQTTMNLLTMELSNLSAKNIVVQLALPENKIRQDGLPYSDARPDHPGVILTFDSRHGPLSLACDRLRDWRHNLRAIALNLEGLRKADLYGVSQSGEQYRGYTALPAPPPAAPDTSFTSVQEAAVFIANYAGGWEAAQILTNSAVAKSAYFAASLKLHPDTGGTHEQMVRLGAAKDLLDKHHKERR